MGIQFTPKILRTLARPARTKIVQVVIDGVGGLPWNKAPWEGKTALQAAKTPNLDQLAKEGRCGLHFGVAPGIAAGSGPAHLALWLYQGNEPGTERGILETLGVDIDLKAGEVCARGNFATIDAAGLLTDRRAGRPSTKICRALIKKSLSNLGKVDGVSATLYPVREHRVAIVFSGPELSGFLKDTDPQQLGLLPLSAKPLDDYKDDPAAQRMARIVNEFISRATQAISAEPVMNSLIFRGFGKREVIETLESIYGIKCLAIAVAPMYRGVAKAVGMDAIPLDESLSLEGQVGLLAKHWQDYDFFYFHAKKTDTYGEDGEFGKKVEEIGRVDKIIPQIRALKPDVLVITSDHSTPALLMDHSYHPMPTILWSKNGLTDEVAAYDEIACIRGGLGPDLDPRTLFTMMLYEAGRLKKWGA